MQEGDDDSRPGAAERVAESDGAAARVDFRGVEVEDLRCVSLLVELADAFYRV